MTRHDARLIAEELMKLQRYTEPYIDRKGASEYLSMSLDALDKHIDIPKYRIGRCVRFRKSDLDFWVQNQSS